MEEPGHLSPVAARMNSQRITAAGGGSPTLAHDLAVLPLAFPEIGSGASAHEPYSFHG